MSPAYLQFQTELLGQGQGHRIPRSNSLTFPEQEHSIKSTIDTYQSKASHHRYTMGPICANAYAIGNIWRTSFLS